MSYTDVLLFPCCIPNSKAGSQVLFDSSGENEAICRSDGKAGTAVFRRRAAELLSGAEQFANSNICATQRGSSIDGDIRQTALICVGADCCRDEIILFHTYLDTGSDYCQDFALSL